jgi:hypothetical protein
MYVSQLKSEVNGYGKKEHQQRKKKRMLLLIFVSLLASKKFQQIKFGIALLVLVG